MKSSLLPGTVLSKLQLFTSLLCFFISIFLLFPQETRYYLLKYESYFSPQSAPTSFPGTYSIRPSDVQYGESVKIISFSSTSKHDLSSWLHDPSWLLVEDLSNQQSSVDAQISDGVKATDSLLHDIGWAIVEEGP